MKMNNSHQETSLIKNIHLCLARNIRKLSQKNKIGLRLLSCDFNPSQGGQKEIILDKIQHIPFQNCCFIFKKTPLDERYKSVLLFRLGLSYYFNKMKK